MVKRKNEKKQPKSRTENLKQKVPRNRATLFAARFLKKTKALNLSERIRNPFARDKYGYNNLYLTKNAKPYFPIMGEMHYARTNRDTWREEMVKMKSCGIDTITTYIFWIYHEQVEGEYDFSGNFDIRTFIKTADELGLKVWIRIGPFIHAELRNGGFPDWLIEKCPKIRCNDEKYLREVTKYFKRLYQELEGLFYKDGGPITGIQLENEFGHVGGGTRPENEAHLKTLRKIINEIGYSAPYYTATGWGTATVGDCIPTMGGYCDAPWSHRSDKLEPSTNYVITKERDDHMVGWGNEIGIEESYKYEDYPFLTAELGGGLCATYRRRPVLKAEDIGAVSLVKLANGCNCLGYYMFHGGICPKGINYPLNETEKTGSWCDLPEFDYNFFAPIGSYGNFNETYKELKLLFNFLRDFGEEFCSMESEIECKVDEDGKIYELDDSHPNNLKSIRHSVRHNGNTGYLFVNNYVKGYELKNHTNVKFKGLVDKYIDGISQFPEFDIKNGDYFFGPFNMKVGDLLIKTATTTPLCKLKDKNGFDDYLFIYGENERMDVIFGKRTKVITLPKREALNANKITLDRDYLFITDGHIIVDGNKLLLYSSYDTNDDIIVYPKNDDLNLMGYEVEKNVSMEYSLYKSLADDRNMAEIVEVSQISENISNTGYLISKDAKTIDMKVKLDYDFDMESEDNNLILDEIDLKITYKGDMLKLIVDGEIVNDNFNNNEAFTVGLKYHGYPKELVIRIYGLDEDSEIYFEKPTEFIDGLACELSKIETSTRYRKLIHEKKLMF